MISTLNKYPDCENFLEPLKKFFSFLKIGGGDFQQKAFPYSLKQLSKEKVLNCLTNYYRTTFLDEAGARQILWSYGVNNNLAPESLPEGKKNECFLNSLTNNSQLSTLLTEFFEYLSSHVAYASMNKLSEAMQTLKQHFSSHNVVFKDGLEQQVLSKLEINYSSRTVRMIETFSNGQAKLSLIHI